MSKQTIGKVIMAAAIITLAFAIAGCGDGNADNARQSGKSGGEGVESGLSGGTPAKTGGSEADDEDKEEKEEVVSRKSRKEAEKAPPKPDPVQEFLSKPPVKVETKTKTITLPGGEKMEMVWCPSGTFVMGSPESEKGRARREHQIKVTLTKGFWIGKYEVTQRQYKSVIGKNPSLAKFQDDDLPVGIITWPLADAFCQKVGARLPTSAEWEYA